MHSYDVSLDDEMVVDKEGTVWVVRPNEEWGYITDDGVTEWDTHAELPEQYSPYVRLDKAAQRVIRKGLSA